MMRRGDIDEPAAPRRRMTRREWRIRRCLRLARNWLPAAHAPDDQLADRITMAPEYHQLNLADARLVLVNAHAAGARAGGQKLRWDDTS